MKLRELLRGVKTIEIDADPDAEIEGVAHDSRKVRPGYLFVCITGFRHDGHDFIPDAVSRGARIILSEKRLPPMDGVGRVRVEDSREALAIIASNFWRNPSSKLKVIGITGTNGKTTTSYLIRSILSRSGLRPALIGTIRYELGDKLLPAPNTTPDPIELQRLMGEAIGLGLKSVVMEVSSHGLQLRRVDGVRFDVGVFSNLSRDHLDFHGTFESYREAKLRLFDLLKPDGKAVINADDPSADIFARRAASNGADVVRFGLRCGGADVTASDIRFSIAGTSFVLHTPSGDVEVDLKLPGEYNVYNAMAAAAAAAAVGIGVEAIKEGLEAVTSVPGRFERVDLGQGFGVIIDYAHTPDALERLLRAVRKLTEGRVISVFGCGGDRDKGKRPEMGRISAELADHTIVTSDNPRSEDPMEIIEQIVAGMPPGSSYEVIPDRFEAIGRAIRMARPGDCVVIAGKGHEDYQIIGDERIPFSDREAALEHLREVLRG